MWFLKPNFRCSGFTFLMETLKDIALSFKCVYKVSHTFKKINNTLPFSFIYFLLLYKINGTEQLQYSTSEEAAF